MNYIRKTTAYKPKTFKTLLKRLGAPLPGTRANKTLSPFLNKLFLVRSIQGLRVEIEDLASGTIKIADSDRLKVYRTRESYFNELSPILQAEMGREFKINLRLDDRKAIIQKLSENGFDVSQSLSLDRDEENDTKPNSKNLDKDPKKIYTPENDYNDNPDDVDSLDLTNRKKDLKTFNKSISDPSNDFDEIDKYESYSPKSLIDQKDKNDVTNDQTDLSESEADEDSSDDSDSHQSSDDDKGAEGDKLAVSDPVSVDKQTPDSQASIKKVGKMIKNKINPPPFAMKLRNRPKKK